MLRAVINCVILVDMITKTSMRIKDGSVVVSMPFSKVDREKRIVAGFATLNNVDSQGDIVVKTASEEAFRRFRGNVREQHDATKAVGRVVDFTPGEYYDNESGSTYEGIFVKTYVSKGAEDTWQKVLDGTLTGFSIAGEILEATSAIDTKTEEQVRIVTKYNLSELSLVDSPANKLANVVTIEKLDSGDISVNTPLVEGGIENIFFCKEDDLIITKSDESHSCELCGNKMENIGFVESGDKDSESIIKASLADFRKSNENEKEVTKVAENTTNEAEADGLPDVVDSELEKSDSETPTVSDDVVEKSDEVVEDNSVEKADTDEVAADSDAVAVEKIDDLSTLLVESLTKLADAVALVNDKIETLTKSVSVAKSDIEKVGNDINEFGKRVDAVEDTTAFRKSGDIGDIAKAERREDASPWGGSFLNSASL